MKSNRSLIFSLGVLGCLLSFTPAHADFVYSPVDTYMVIDTWGKPGETVDVPVYFANTELSVAGIYFRIVYERTYLTPAGFTIDSTRLEGLNWLVTTNDTMQGEVRFVGVDLLAQNFLRPGAGPIAFVSFQINPGFTQGELLLCFEDNETLDPPIQNSFSDSAATNNYIPIQVYGYVRVYSGDNRPPVLDPIPGGNQQSLFEGDTLSFTVSGYDVDENQVTLYAIDLPQNATFSNTTGNGQASQLFTFTPNFLQAGEYTVTFIISDNGTPLLADSAVVNITVRDRAGNMPPVFSPQVPDQTVDEGDTLRFTVRAVDPEGGEVTLSAVSLPPNATFPEVSGISPVSQTFSFVPNYAQGPDTVTVSFVAWDEADSASYMDVDIEIVDKFDILKIFSNGGGLPGNARGRIPIQLINNAEIYGLEFDIRFDPAILSIDSIIPGDRLKDMTIYDNIGDSAGVVTVLVLDYGLQCIPVGSDIVLEFACSVDPLAICGPTPLTLTSALGVIDAQGSTRVVGAENGFFTVDLLGDATLNAEVNIGDVVAIVSYILGQNMLDVRHGDAADVNRDGQINVGDIVGVINIILGRPLNHSPVGGPSGGILATVDIEIGDLAMGEVSVVVDLKVPVAGVQLSIDYDPNQLRFCEPQLADYTPESFVLINRVDEQRGNLTVILFGQLPLGESIPPGRGTILNLPAELVAGVREDVNLKVEQAILADTEGWVIPVQMGTSLPESYSLSQNYPNPFNPTTTIEYALPKSSQVSLKIYNVLGQRVRTLVMGEEQAGIHRVKWDGRDDYGERLSSGVYFYCLEAESFSSTRKMVMVK